MNNIQRLHLFCDLLQDDGYVLESSQIRNWVETLSDPAKAHLESMSLDFVRLLGIGLAAAVIEERSATGVRNAIAKVLGQFKADYLNVHVVI
jgi:hypothetical protein